MVAVQANSSQDPPGSLKLLKFRVRVLIELAAVHVETGRMQDKHSTSDWQEALLL